MRGGRRLVQRKLVESCSVGLQAVRRTHVDIVDLIEWGRSGSEEKPSDLSRRGRAASLDQGDRQDISQHV